MSLALPGGEEKDKARDIIPRGSFSAPQTFEQFMGGHEQRTLLYVNDVCGNIILDPSEVHGIEQGRLRKFVGTGSPTINRPLNAFCVPSAITRKQELGWNARRIEQYIALTALTGLVPTDEKDRYLPGYETALGHYLVKIQFYRETKHIENYSEVWQQHGHLYESLAMQAPCLEDNILPGGYTLGFTTPEDDHYHKIDFYLVHQATGEKIGIQFTIDRDSVDRKRNTLEIRRKNNGAMAVVFITPRGKFTTSYSELMDPSYAEKSHLLFAERMKKEYSDDYKYFCGQLREAFLGITHQANISNPDTGVIVSILPSLTLPTMQTPAPLPEKDLPESTPENGSIDVSALPADMQTQNGFESRWNNILLSFERFGNFMANLPGIPSAIRDLVARDWEMIKYAYTPSGDFASSITYLEEKLNEFIGMGESNTHKDGRRSHIRTMLKEFLECEPKVFVTGQGDYLSFDKTRELYTALQGVQDTNGAKLFDESITAQIHAFEGIMGDLMQEIKTEEFKQTLANIKNIIIDSSTADYKDVTAQILGKVTDADVDAGLKQIEFIPDLINEINQMLREICEIRNLQICPQINIPQLRTTVDLAPAATTPAPAAIPASAPITPVTVPAPTAAVPVSVLPPTPPANPTVPAPAIAPRPAVVPAPAHIPAPTPASPAAIVPPAQRTSEVLTAPLSPTERLQINISSLNEVISRVQSQIESLTNGAGDVETELKLFKSGKVRFNDEITKTIQEITDARNAVLDTISLARKDIEADDFYTRISGTIQSAVKAENEKKQTLSKLKRDLVECENAIKRAEEKLAQAQQDIDTKKSTLEQQKAAAEIEKQNILKALEVMAKYGV